MSTAEAAATAATNGDAEEAAKHTLLTAAVEQVGEIRERATKIKDEANYDGTLDAKVYEQLYELLRAPTPSAYVKFTPRTEGKPYDSTGVRSVQVQVDRMNDVLGAQHWRVLYDYQDGGQLCRVVVVVGNHLSLLRLDDGGNLTWPDGAEPTPEVLVVREGYGGHSRGRAKGDLFKGSETNALKRTLARVGPGCDVYRNDYDDDVNLASEPEYADRQQARARSQQRAQQPAPAAAAPEQEQEQATLDGKTWDQQLEELLAGYAAVVADEGATEAKRNLAALHIKAAEGMRILAAPARQQVQELEAAKTKKPAEALVARIGRALDETMPDPTAAAPEGE